MAKHDFEGKKICCLYRLDGPTECQLIALEDKEKVTIGRHIDNDVVLSESPTISRRQLVLEKKKGTWTIQDQGSSNGIWVNGVKLASYQWHRLADRDIIEVGPDPRTSKRIYKYQYYLRAKIKTNVAEDKPPLRRIRTENDRKAAEEAVKEKESLAAKLQELQANEKKAVEEAIKEKESLAAKLQELQANERKAVEEAIKEKESLEAELQELQANEKKAVEEAIKEKESLAAKLQELQANEKKAVEEAIKEKESLETKLQELQANERKAVEEAVKEKESLAAKLQELQANEKKAVEEAIKEKESLEAKLHQVQAEHEETQAGLAKRLEKAEASHDLAVTLLEEEQKRLEEATAREIKIRESLQKEMEEKKRDKTIVSSIEDALEEELVCAICSELLIQATSLGCSHSFCAHCINQWMDRKKVCPNCRKDIKSSVGSIVLDNYIDKVVQVLGREQQEKRKQLVEERKIEQQRWQAQKAAAVPPPRTIVLTPVRAPVPRNVVPVGQVTLRAGDFRTIIRGQQPGPAGVRQGNPRPYTWQAVTQVMGQLIRPGPHQQTVPGNSRAGQNPGQGPRAPGAPAQQIEIAPGVRVTWAQGASGQQQITAPRTQGVTGQVRPAPPQPRPAAAQGRPAAAQGRPAAAQGRPAAAQGRPAPAQGRPAAAQGRPAPAQGRPAAAQGRPAAAQGRPGPAQIGPGPAQIGPGPAQIGRAPGPARSRGNTAGRQQAAPYRRPTGNHPRNRP